ncbi:MAG: circadian clock protein KaiC [Pedosphaera sp.]|nr:circadian clock protein KaiC [Pedosphaera sp.]
MVELPSIEKDSTGIQGLDDILGGGFPKNRLYMIQGDPGVGKTTLALQYLQTGVRAGEKCLYITLSETREELMQVAESHGWSLAGIDIFELSAVEQQLAAEAENTLFHPSEVELNRTTQLLLNEVERVKPERLVFDSLSEMRLLAETPLRYRRQMLALKTFFAHRKTTVLLLDDRTGEHGDQQVQSIAHGVISLETVGADFGVERRRLKVVKIRGLKYRSGYHDFNIERGGIEVFPRLVASEHHVAFKREPVSSDVAEMDRLLGGGLDRGTSNLFLGPAGTGKSTMALQFAMAMASRGEKVMLYSFDENLGTMLARAKGLGMDIQKHLDSKMISAQQIDPAELPPGEFAARVRASVEKDAKLVIIDSLNGFLNAMPNEKHLIIQLHELLSYLNQQGMLTIMTLAQHGLMGPMNSPVDVSYLADTVLLLRYFEAFGSIRKAVSIIKKRSGRHEDTIREYQITSDGVRVGKPLKEFQGVLTGIPSFRGESEQIMTSNVGSRPKLS